MTRKEEPMTPEDRMYNWLKFLRAEAFISWPLIILVLTVLWERGHHTAFWLVLGLELLSAGIVSKRMDMLQDRLNIPHP